MSDIQKTFALPKHRPELKAFLSNRRSNLAKLMAEPGPSEEQLLEFLEIAARVPDHRKLEPWRFIIFKNEARAEFGKHIASAFMKDNPTAPLDRSIFEGQRLLRAPVVIAVVSSPVDCPRGTPEWEQILSAGAACFNLCLAAQASGFGAQWLTEWFAYEDSINSLIRLEPTEKIAGYIYIGTPESGATERKRPNLAEKITLWA